jgi:glycosyltransferase involved in cell wall biosynthesis
MNPKISIITICRNAGKELQKTIDSVIHQTYSEIEFVFVDGLSDDSETVEIIERNRTNFHQFKREKDNGIYNAMNKGISMATGNFLLFLNAGDRLADDYSVEAAVKLMQKKEAMIYFTVVVWVDTENKVVRSGIPEINFVSDFYSKNFPHSGSFYAKDCFKDFGVYDETYKILGDFDMNLRLLVNHKLPFCVLNVLVSVFYTGGISTSEKGKELRSGEMERIRNKYSLSPDSPAKKSIFGKRNKKESEQLNRLY